jgi:glycosyltransferase involved in cell wall biosynthesis
VATEKTLLWYSPFGPHSDIGAFSRPILHALERNLCAPFTGLELVIEPNGPTYRPHVPFRFIDDRPPPTDALCLFNVGNDKNNHRRINELAMRHGGLVVLHDVVLHDFMVWYHLQNRQDRVSYAAEVARDGGAELARAVLQEFCPAQDRPPGRIWEREPLRALPMLSAVLAPARGVVVHSAFAAAMARRYTQAPICQLFLSAEQKRIYSDKDLEQWRARTRGAGTVRVTSFGNITRNKRLELICRAFADSALLRATATLRIVGHARDQLYLEELRDLIAAEKLSGTVELAASVDERRLARFKDETDVFVLLRQPNIEGASGSLVEALNTGRPVVAMTSGCFAELPQGALAPIVPEDDGAQLRATLEGLVADPERRIAIGAAGHAHQQTRSADLYARTLLDFTRDLPGSAPAGTAEPRDAMLERLVATQRMDVVADILCGGKLRCPPGSRIAAAVQAVLEPCDRADRILLVRALDRLLDHLLTGAPLSLSQASLARLAEVILQFGPTAFVSLFGSLMSDEAGLSRDQAVLGFRSTGPARWPAALPPRIRPDETLPWMALTPGERTETTSAHAWSAQFLTSWHRPEPTGTWTNGRFAIFPVARPPGPRDRRYRLSVGINNVSGRLQDETVAGVEGQTVPVRIRREDRLRIAEIPLAADAPGDGWLVILDIGDASRPSDRGGRDARLLGAKICWIALEALPLEKAVTARASRGRGKA